MRKSMREIARISGVEKELRTIQTNIGRFRNDMDNDGVKGSNYITQKNLSQMTPLSENDLKKYESLSRYPTIKKLLYLSNYYKISIDSFVDEKGIMKPGVVPYQQADIDNIPQNLVQIQKEKGKRREEILEALYFDSTRSYTNILSGKTELNIVYAVILCKNVYYCTLDYLLFRRQS